MKFSRDKIAGHGEKHTVCGGVSGAGAASVAPVNSLLRTRYKWTHTGPERANERTIGFRGRGARGKRDKVEKRCFQPLPADRRSVGRFFFLALRWVLFRFSSF